MKSVGFYIAICILLLVLTMQTSWARPVVAIYYVAMNGRDTWTGKLPAPNKAGTDGPVATLARALELARHTKQAPPENYAGARIFVRGGAYPQNKSLTLTAEDSGTADVPLQISAYKDEAVRIIGGREVANWKPVTDEGVLNRMEAACRGKVVQADLKAQGITDYGEIKPNGQTSPPMLHGLEVFFQSKPMQIARWPSKGWAYIADAPQGQNGGMFTYDAAKTENRPARWKNVEDVWLHGYWSFDWADSYTKIKSVDTAAHAIYTQEPHGAYGYTKGKRFYALNVLEELDTPGEWYLDRKAGILYFWPPAPITSMERVMVSLLDTPLLRLENASNILVQGLTLEDTRGVAVEIVGGAHNRVAACTIRNTGLMGVNIDGGNDNGVDSCTIYDTGQGSIKLSGGDRKTLVSAGNYAHNNEIHDYSRWVRCYRPAVEINGVGNRVSHNLIYNGPHNAIQLSGNEHIIEYNEVHDVCRETGDVGAFYMGRDWTMRGNVVRFNYFHNLGGPKTEFGGEGFFDAMGVYLDDAASGTTVAGNIFYKVGRGVLVGGGHDNKIAENLFVDCSPAVHVDARGTSWAKKYIAPGGEWGMYDKLKAVSYKQPPYRSRYPKLAIIEADNPAFPTGIEITENTCYGGKWLELQDGLNDKTIHFTGNIVEEKQTDILTALSFWLTGSGSLGRPRSHIGLIRNVYRPDIPVDKVGLAD